LQIIITYDGLLSNHAALRLVANHGNVTFWDPAGAYGLRSPSADEAGSSPLAGIQRVKDLVVTQIPDLPTYIQFRWYVGDVTVEVFEWDLAPQDAKFLEEVVRNDSQAVSETPVFHTETAPAFCTVAISEFLQRFAGFLMTLPDWYLWPHNLAHALLRQGPTRIRVFQRNSSELTYVSPHRSAGRPHAMTDPLHHSPLDRRTDILVTTSQ